LHHQIKDNITNGRKCQPRKEDLKKTVEECGLVDGMEERIEIKLI